MKISLVGAGNIGSTLASLLIAKGAASEISLIDIDENLAIARKSDLEAMAVILGSEVKIAASENYEIAQNSDIVVISAGIARKVGQSRDDLLKINAKIVAEISAKIAKFAPNSIIIMVTNPLDFLVFVAYKCSGFPKNRVIGMAGELDTARAKISYAALHGISPKEAKIRVFGTHNEGMKFECEKDAKFEQISRETIDGGARIARLCGNSAFIAPAAGVLKLILAIQNGGNVIASVLDENEIPFGREISLGAAGVKEIVNNEIYGSIEVSKIKEMISKFKIN